VGESGASEGNGGGSETHLGCCFCFEKTGVFVKRVVKTEKSKNAFL
jgi:hypothetical protein